MERNKNWKAKTIVISAIVIFSIIAMAQTAVAQPPAITVKGTVTYTNGTTAPYGWDVSISVDDKDYSADGEPWTGTTQFQWPIWDYSIAACAYTDDVVRATVNSPDLVYTGTNTAVCPGPGTMYINVTVSKGPEVDVIYPDGGEVLTIGTVEEVSASVVGPNNITSVNFTYYDGTDWNTIGAGIRVSGEPTDGIWNASWNTVGCPEGDAYLIKAEATDEEGGIADDTSTSTFTLYDGTKPLMRNASVAPSSVMVNETTPITFYVDVADRDTGIDVVVIDMNPGPGTDYKLMSKVGEYPLDTLTWEIYEYETSISFTSEGNYTYTVTVRDTSAALNTNSTDITVKAVTTQPFNISICTGWNLIAIPLNLSDPSLAKAITGAEDEDTIYRWVPGEGYKSAYYGGGQWWGQPEEVEPIEPGVGYWFDRKGADYNLTIEGDPLAGTTIETLISTGWNLIGYASLEETSLSVINDPEDEDTIYRWVPGEGYKSAYYGGGQWWGQPEEVEPIEPGVGYWFDRKGSAYYWTYTA